MNQRMDPDDVILLRFKRDEVRAEYRHDGKKHTKFLNVSDIASILATDVKLDTGFLYLAGPDYLGVRNYSKIGATEIITFEASPAKRKLKFDTRGSGADRIREVVTPTPYIVMIAVIVNNRWSDGVILTSKYPIVGDNVRLYSWPFGNAYADGRICWGGNAAVNNASEKFSVFNKFLDSPFNMDLHFMHAGIRTEGNLTAFTDFLSAQQEFNMDHLNPHNGRSSRTHSTYREIIQDLERRYANSGNLPADDDF